MKSEMLKTRKKAKQSSSEFSQEFPEFWESQKFCGIPGNLFENFPFPKKLKIWEKGNPSSVPSRILTYANLPK